VLVTHDIEQARRLAAYVLRIDAGTVTGQGPVDEVLARDETGGASPSAAAPPRFRAAT
jgi:ABC-type sulfate/molybdate transport systems ATPase subunit